MDELERERILKELSQDNIEEVWPKFLVEYSAELMKVVKHFCHNEDDSSECFLFVSEHLHNNNCQRLKSFNIKGSAKFTTWLYTVTYNLCLDWWRTKHPRNRIFSSIKKLSQFHQKVFELHFRQGYTVPEMLEELRKTYPNLDLDELIEVKHEVAIKLTPQQRIQLQQPKVVSLFNDSGELIATNQPEEAKQSEPESNSLRLQNKEYLDQALNILNNNDILLLRLRFERDFSLIEIARFMEFDNAQAVDRRIKKVMKQLKVKINEIIAEKSVAAPCNKIEERQQ